MSMCKFRLENPTFSRLFVRHDVAFSVPFVTWPMQYLPFLTDWDEFSVLCFHDGRVTECRKNTCKRVRCAETIALVTRLAIINGFSRVSA